MHWRTKYTRKTCTKIAEPAPGYCYEIVARDFGTPLKVYETTPTEKRHLIASLPAPDNAAVMVAEREWEVQLRRQHDAENFCKVIEERNNGPKVSFLVTVPEHQALTAQEAFNYLYGTVLDMRMIQQAEEEIETTGLLHRPSLWKAVRAVNTDLHERGDQPLMKELPLLGPPMNGRDALVLTLFLQTHYRWDGEDNLPRALWKERGEIWSDIAEANRELMAPRYIRVA